MGGVGRYSFEMQELVAAEAKNCGKPKQLTMEEELPPVLPTATVLAGADAVYSM